MFMFLAVLSMSTATYGAVDIRNNQVGRLTSVGNDFTRTYTQYDEQGRPLATQIVQDQQSRTFTTQYGYPHHPLTTPGPGMMTIQQTFADGERVEYTYDLTGLQTSVRSVLGNRAGNVVVDTRANARGQITHMELGNGTVTTMTYDDGGHQRLTRSVTVSSSGAVVQDYAYEYDDNGNVTSMADGVELEKSITLQYDTLDQLISVSDRHGQVLQQYEYDELGNLSRKDALRQEYGVGAGPHALTKSGDAAYAYDPNGNVISIGGLTSIEWNSENMPRRAVAGSDVAERAYVGEAIWKKVERGAEETVTTYYLPSMRMENGIARKYYGVAAERLEKAGDDQLRFYHPDHLGSAAVMTDAKGAVIRRARYWPWGQEREVAKGSFEPELNFNFKEIDEAGFYDYGARLYDPRTGRWLSPDTVLADGLNRYAYARNNPWTFTDPTGHAVSDPPESAEDENKNKRWTFSDWLDEVQETMYNASLGLADAVKIMTNPLTVAPKGVGFGSNGEVGWTKTQLTWGPAVSVAVEAMAESKDFQAVLYLGAGNGDFERFQAKALEMGANIVVPAPPGASQAEIWRICAGAIKTTLRNGGTVIMDMRDAGGDIWRKEAKFTRRIARQCPECFGGDGGGIRFLRPDGEVNKVRRPARR
jgi:RHS repeat-associated protein